MLSLGVSDKATYATANSATTPGVATQAKWSAFVVGVIYEAGGAALTAPGSVSISDSKGNRWDGTKVCTIQNLNANYNFWLDLYLLPRGIGGASHTFTATVTNGYPTVFVQEVKTGGRGVRYKKHAVASDSDGTYATPFVAGAVKSEIEDTALIGLFAGSFSDTTVGTAGNGFAFQQTQLSVSSAWQGALMTRERSSNIAPSLAYNQACNGISAITLALIEESQPKRRFITRVEPSIQPQGSVEIDWSNPLARGLVASWLPINGGYDPIARGSPYVFGGSSVMSSIVSAPGIALTTNGTDGYFYRDRPPLVDVQEWTAFAVVQSVGAVSTDRRVWGVADSTNTNSIAHIGTGVTDATKVRLWSRDHYTSQPSSSGAETTRPVFDGLPHSVIVGFRKADYTMFSYVDGIPDATQAFNGPASGWMMNRASVGCLYRVNSSNFFSGGVYVAFMWDRPLADREARAISENPWQLFLRSRRTIFTGAPVIEHRRQRVI